MCQLNSKKTLSNKTKEKKLNEKQEKKLNIY